MPVVPGFEDEEESPPPPAGAVWTAPPVAAAARAERGQALPVPRNDPVLQHDPAPQNEPAPHDDPATHDEPAPKDDPAPEPAMDAEPQPGPAEVDAATDNGEPEAVADTAATEAEPEDSDLQQPVAVTATPQRSIDDSLLAVLREEAEREANARRNEAPRAMETQPDLGLEDTVGAVGVAGSVKSRLSRLRGQEPEPEVTERPAARRDLLPDIEEINSTLRASSENRSGMDDQDDEPEPATARGGFRSGFALMLLIGAILIGVYLGAPRIAQHMPAAAGPLRAYVSAVDGMRQAVDGLMKSATAGLQGLSGGNGN